MRTVSQTLIPKRTQLLRAAEQIGQKDSAVSLFCILSSVKLIPYTGKPEVKALVFVTADRSRAQLERLTQLLLSAFPGSTIYQHPDPSRVPHDALNNKVDAVFLEAAAENPTSLSVTQMLHRQKPDLPIFIISKTNCLCEQAVEAGAAGYFVLPGGEQQLLDAVCSAHTKKTQPIGF